MLCVDILVHIFYHGCHIFSALRNNLRILDGPIPSIGRAEMLTANRRGQSWDTVCSSMTETYVYTYPIGVGWGGVTWHGLYAYG